MKHRVLKGSKNCATVQQECNQCNCQSLSVHNGAKHFFVDSMPALFYDLTKDSIANNFVIDASTVDA